MRRKPLLDWLIFELNERLDVPKKLAREWLETEQILPLQDGLDEVAATARDACVEAINRFRRGYGLLPIAVCSRIADYKALGSKLRLAYAVETQALTKLQVEEYLQRVGEPMRGLRAALAEDPLMWEVLETPLMVWVGMLAYREETLVSEATSLRNIEQRRSQLFTRFVEATFRRKGDKLKFSQDQTTRWLPWLAWNLTTHNQTFFYLESLDFTWLRTRSQRWLASIGLVISSGLIGALICGLINLLSDVLDLGLIDGLIFGLGKDLIFPLILRVSGGLIGGFIGIAMKVKPAEKLTFRWTDISSRKGLALREGLVGGLIVGLSGGLIFGSIRLLVSEAIPETRFDVNQGTKRSIKMSLLFLLLFFGLIVAVSFSLNGELIYGVIYMLIVGLFFGGLFVLRHLVVRLFLWRSNSAPLRYVQFLQQSKQLLFLRQVGGGYIFLHRLLREYFVSLLPTSRFYSSNERL